MTSKERQVVVDHINDLRSYVSYEEGWKLDRLEGDVQNLLSYINKLEEEIYNMSMNDNK